jgi:hypothetical protein
MDSITFEVGDITIQLVAGTVMLWSGTIDKPADIEMPLEKLRQALSTAGMLIAPGRVG